MSDRYLVTEPLVGDRASLVGDEAHHLARVMRARVGDEVWLFDGRGREVQARVEQLERGRVGLVFLSSIGEEPPPRLRVELQVALPKGDRQRWLVEKAVELGVCRLTPLVTERSVALPEPAALVRLRRTVLEASKQAGRSRLMELADPQEVALALANPQPGELRLLAHTGGGEASLTPGEVVGRLAAQRRVEFAIGPEGGFSDAEVELALGLAAGTGGPDSFAVGAPRSR